MRTMRFVVCVIGALFVAVFALAACGGTTIYNSGTPATATTTTTTTTTTQYVPTPRGTVTVPQVMSPTPTFSVPEGFSYAGNGLYTTNSMSEPFAQAIYNAYTANGTNNGTPVDLGQVYSPVTGQSYDVQCSGYGSNTGVICTNTTTGNQAQVVFANPP